MICCERNDSTKVSIRVEACFLGKKVMNSLGFFGCEVNLV